MTPIQTKYKGYNFRSRLEARWAVFFDALGWKWIYEPEGFILKDGTFYLVDFYLPEIQTYIEIKGAAFTWQEDKKCELLSEGLGDYFVVMLASGLPEPTSYKCYTNGQENCSITITSYIRSKGWSQPYFGGYWDDDDLPAFDLARSARFEHGETPLI